MHNHKAGRHHRAAQSGHTSLSSTNSLARVPQHSEDHADSVSVMPKGDAKQAYWKSLEYFWLANPGTDVSAFLSANKRWDAWYEVSEIVPSK